MCACIQGKKKGILCKGQQPGSAVNSFSDQGKFETMKTLSGRRVLRCGKHQFHAKITKIWHFRHHTPLHSAVFREAFG